MDDLHDFGNSQNGSDDADVLRVLAGQEDPVSGEFLARVRRSIHRRTSVAQFSVFGWKMPGVALLELLRIAGHVSKSFGKEKTPWK
jgi:hypothetical protein